jgi:hypothetical protein
MAHFTDNTTVSCTGLDITIACDDHDTKDAIMDILCGAHTDALIALSGANREWNEMRQQRDALALQVLVLEQQRDEARAARSSQ